MPCLDCLEVEVRGTFRNAPCPLMRRRVTCSLKPCLLARRFASLFPILSWRGSVRVTLANHTSRLRKFQRAACPSPRRQSRPPLPTAPYRRTARKLSGQARHLFCQAREVLDAKLDLVARGRSDASRKVDLCKCAFTAIETYEMVRHS